MTYLSAYLFLSPVLSLSFLSVSLSLSLSLSVYLSLSDSVSLCIYVSMFIFCVRLRVGECALYSVLELHNLCACI